MSQCPECHGRTLEFRRTGKDTEYKVCSRFLQPGHLSQGEIQAKIRQIMRGVFPSGRQA